MSKLPGTDQFIEQLDYAIEKVQDPKAEEGPSIILLKPADASLTERIEQTLVFLADPTGVSSPMNFSPYPGKKQYLDYVANYKDCIGIIFNKTGESVECVEGRIRTKLSEILNTNLNSPGNFEIRGMSYCRPGVETSSKMIREAYVKIRIARK